MSNTTNSEITKLTNELSSAVSQLRYANLDLSRARALLDKIAEMVGAKDSQPGTLIRAIRTLPGMRNTIKVIEHNDGTWTIDTEAVCAPGQDLNQALQARGTGDYLCIGIDGTRAFIQVL